MILLDSSIVLDNDNKKTKSNSNDEHKNKNTDNDFECDCLKPSHWQAISNGFIPFEIRRQSHE